LYSVLAALHDKRYSPSLFWKSWNLTFLQMNVCFYFEHEQDFWSILGTDDTRKNYSLKMIAVL